VKVTSGTLYKSHEKLAIL